MFGFINRAEEESSLGTRLVVSGAIDDVIASHPWSRDLNRKWRKTEVCL